MNDDDDEGSVPSSASAEYSLDFEDEHDDDDHSESAYLPNVKVSPIEMTSHDDCAMQMSDFEEEFKKASLEVDLEDEACVVESVLRMHPPMTSSKKTKTSIPSTTSSTISSSAIKEEWRDAYDANSGRTYYYNRRTRETRWKLPNTAILVPRKKKKSKTPSKLETSESLLFSTPELGSSRSATAAAAATSTPSTLATACTTITNTLSRIEVPVEFSQSGVTGTAHEKDLDNKRPFDGNSNVTAEASTPNIATPTRPLMSPPSIKRDLNHRHSDKENSAMLPSNAISSLHRSKEVVCPIYCIYCSTCCTSPETLGDHLIACEDYMMMLAKRPAVQKKLEEMMLRTWGIQREKLPDVDDSFDARLRATSNEATSTNITSTAAVSCMCNAEHYLLETPPLPNTRPVTATSADYRYSGSKSQSLSFLSPPQADYGSTSTALDGTRVGLEEEDEDDDAMIGYYCEDDAKNTDYNLSDSPPKSECAFCGRSFENLSKHLLRCKNRQRTQERRKRSQDRRPPTSSAIQTVLSGGRDLPGHPKGNTRRRLDYR